MAYPQCNLLYNDFYYLESISTLYFCGDITQTLGIPFSASLKLKVQLMLQNSWTTKKLSL